MPVQVLNKDGSTAPIKKSRGKGRPKGAKDKTPRKKPRHNTVAALRRQIIKLENKVDTVTAENDRLSRGYTDNPLVLVRGPQGKDLTREQVEAIADMPSGETQPGTKDELLAVHDRRSRVARLMLRGVSRAQITECLSISSKTLQADINAVRDSWRRNVTQFSIEEAIGESLDFYREVRDVALREAAAPNRVSDAIQAANTALKAEDSKNAFLARLGLWDLLHDDKARAFRGQSQRTLEQDDSDFAKVISFMSKVGAAAVEDDFNDISPLDS
jgi:hypothetical protein